MKMKRRVENVGKLSSSQIPPNDISKHNNSENKESKVTKKSDKDKRRQEENTVVNSKDDQHTFEQKKERSAKGISKANISKQQLSSNQKQIIVNKEIKTKVQDRISEECAKTNQINNPIPKEGTKRDMDAQAHSKKKGRGKKGDTTGPNDTQVASTIPETNLAHSISKKNNDHIPTNETNQYLNTKTSSKNKKQTNEEHIPDLKQTQAMNGISEECRKTNQQNVNIKDDIEAQVQYPSTNVEKINNPIPTEVTKINTDAQASSKRKRRGMKGDTTGSNDTQVASAILTNQPRDNIPKRRSESDNNYMNKKPKMDQNLSVKNIKNNKQIPSLRPLSLTNMGATCYLNSAFQGISACDTFVNEINLMCTMYKDSDIKLLSVFKRLIDILNGCLRDKMEISGNDIFCNWNKTGHQDSYELLAHVMNQVYNEIRQYKERIGDIPRRDLERWLEEKLPMRLLMKYTIVCGCKLISYSPIQSDLALHVTIPRDNKENALNDLIDLYFDADSIEDYACDKPGCSGLGTKRTAKLCKPLPLTVCIHLQRTYWDNTQMKKIKKVVTFQKKLILKSKYWSTKDNSENTSDQNFNGRSCANNCVEEADLVYYLTSVIVHSGTVASGHYVCYKRVNNKWFLANDSWIHEVNEQEVLKCQAYILFYEQPFNSCNSKE